MTTTRDEAIATQLSNAINVKRIWGSLFYNLKELGATGDGSTDDYSKILALLTNIGSNKAVVIVPDGTFRIATNLTFPENILLWFMPGGKLSPDNGVTVTINGGIEAYLYQIFTGSGTVSGNPKVDDFYPQWWGASGSVETTTGSIASGSKSLTVASVIDFAVGQGINVAGAGSSGANLITTIAGISGTTITLTDAASTTVANVAVNHDDTAALQATINARAAADGEKVNLSSRKYKITSVLDLKSNIYLYGSNAVIDMSSAALVDSYRYGIRAKGSVGNSISLTTNATKGNYSFDVADVSGLSAGDWIQLATQGVNFYPYANSPAYNVDRGEIKKIRKIIGNTIYFETAIYDNYTTANGAFIKKITFVENVTIEGIHIIGDEVANSNEMGIYFEYVNGFRIVGNELENQDLYQIGLISCIRGEVSGNRLRMSFYDGVTGSIFYAVAVVDCCQWLRIENNHAERTRHHTVTVASTTGQGRWGQPRFITVVDNIAENLMAGDAGRSYAFEHHGFGEAIVFDSNIIDGCYAGFNLEGGGVTVSNNRIYNWYYGGILMELEGVDYQDIEIVHNTIGEPTIEGGGFATPHSIYLYFQSGDILKNILIHGNIMKMDLTKTSAIYIAGNSGAPNDAFNFILENNEIQNTGANVGTNYAINISYVNKMKVKDNSIYDTQQGIYIQAKECVISGNEIDVDPARTLAAGYGIYVGDNDNWVQGNRIRRSWYGLRINTGVTGTVAKDNIIRSDSTTISDGGTGSTLANNTEIVY